MPNAENSYGINRVVQRLPVSAHSSSDCRKGSESERGKPDDRGETQCNKRSFNQVFADIRESQLAVENQPHRREDERRHSVEYEGLF